MRNSDILIKRIDNDSQRISSRDDIDRFYVTRKTRRKLTYIWDLRDTIIQVLEKYINMNKVKYITDSNRNNNVMNLRITEKEQRI